MITRRNYLILAVVTLLLFASASAIGPDRDVLWIVDEVTFFGFIGCAFALVAMTVAILVRALVRGREHQQG